MSKELEIRHSQYRKVDLMTSGVWIVLFGVFVILLKYNFPKIKGWVGEASVNRILSNLSPEQYKVFHDVYVPNGEGGTTQVDHIVTSVYGIFVIETKHYKGWIFGKEDQKYWTQVIYKRKEKLYNPIWQNFGHLSAIKARLGVEDHHIHSIIAFSNNSTFKFEENFKKARVIQFHQLLKVISEFTTPVLSDSQLFLINSSINELSSVDRREKQQIKKNHLEVVKQKQLQTNVTSSNGCPKCGSKLVMRKGKFGSFHGCSNYPKCRYTKQISS